MSYRIDHQAVGEYAAREYGIIGPVVLVRVRRRLQDNGWYNMRQGDLASAQLWQRDEPNAVYIFHRVRVEGDRPAAEVAESIAHELEHCRQAEEAIRTTDAYDVLPAIREYLLPKGVAYKDRACEVLAREAGRKHGKPLRKECFHE